MSTRERKSLLQRHLSAVALTLGAGLMAVAPLTGLAQSNSVVATNANSAVSNTTRTASQTASIEQSEKIRAACIEGRRLVCGKILEVLPEGLVVESGYTNLLREPINRSWLIPGTLQASKAENLIESKIPGSVCVGRVLLTNTPKGKKFKPAKYDYVIVESYPAGQFTYTSAGAIQRNVRVFSASLVAAVQMNLEAAEKTQPARTKE